MPESYRAEDVETVAWMAMSPHQRVKAWGRSGWAGGFSSVEFANSIECAQGRNIIPPYAAWPEPHAFALKVAQRCPKPSVLPGWLLGALGVPRG